MCNYIVLKLVSVLTMFTVCSCNHCPPPPKLFLNRRNVFDYRCPSGYEVLRSPTTTWCVPVNTCFEEISDCSDDLEGLGFMGTCRCNNQTTVVGGKGEIDCAGLNGKSNLCCSINNCAIGECCTVSAPGKAVGMCKRLGRLGERCNIYLSSDKRNVGFCDCCPPLLCRYNTADAAYGICG